MKKLLSTLLIGLLTSLLAFAQVPPQGINYQAVCRDPEGNPLANASSCI